MVAAVAIQNPTLFNNLYKQLESTPEGANIIQEVKDLYPEAETTPGKIQEEALVRALSAQAQNKINGVKSSTGFTDFLNKLVFAFKQLLRKVFGTSVKVEKLSTDTTLSELAEMLRGDKFDIPTDIISEQDYVDYLRDISNFTKLRENLT
jgi:MoxR-like ATPase